MSEIINRYKLLKRLPHLNAGVIFEHRKWDQERPDMGNLGYGVLTLAWGEDGTAQSGWVAETYIFPGQLIEDKEWFSLVEDKRSVLSEKCHKLQQELNELRNEVFDLDD